MPTLEYLKGTLAGVQAHIGAADHKATALLGIAGVLIAFPAPWILVSSDERSVPFVAAVFAALAAFGFVWSICAALFVLFPRTRNRGDLNSLIYFGDIQALTLDNYSAIIDRADDKRLREDLITQIHVNADIAYRKHHVFKQAVGGLIVGMLFLVFAYSTIALNANNGASTRQTAEAPR